MVDRAVFPCVALVGLGLVACHAPAKTFDPIGRWSSKEGYEVVLRANGTYQFCDRGQCSDGKLERPGGGFGVTLIGFFKKENSVRMSQELKRLYTGQAESFRNNDNLDFTANSGIVGAGSGDTNRFCDYEPCVLFGNLETGPNLAFTLVGS